MPRRCGTTTTGGGGRLLARNAVVDVIDDDGAVLESRYDGGGDDDDDDDDCGAISRAMASQGVMETSGIVIERLFYVLWGSSLFPPLFFPCPAQNNNNSIAYSPHKNHPKAIIS
jgi:hypothetical protein